MSPLIATLSDSRVPDLLDGTANKSALAEKSLSSFLCWFLLSLLLVASVQTSPSLVVRVLH
jgi:hypothetical protein